MKRAWKRIITAVLALALLLSICPVELMGRSALAAGAYGKVTDNGVRLRKQPSTSADYWFKLDTGFVCEIKDVSTSKGITWYKVVAEHNSRWYTGYIHGDYFTPLTDAETASWDGPVPQTEDGAAEEDKDPNPEEDKEETGPSEGTGSSNDTAAPGAMGKVTLDSVNFRKTEGGALIDKLNRDTVVEILSVPAVIDSNHWYKVRYNGQVGYIQAPYLKVVANGGESGAGQNPGGSASGYGYVQLILSSANLRLTPGGKVGEQWETTGEVLAVTGPTQQAGGYTWYPVTFNGKAYFVRQDCVKLQSSPGNSGNSGTSPADPVPETVLGYVRTTKTNVNLRLKPAGETIEQIKKGIILPLVATPVVQGGYTWYYVKNGNIHGYLRGDCVQSCDKDGNNAPAPTSNPGTGVTTPPSSSHGYVKTTKDKVNLRSKPSGSSLEQIAKNIVLPMTGEKIKSGVYDWYPVRAASGRVGYLRGDCVTPTNAAGGTPEDPTTPDTPDGSKPSSSYGYIKVTKTKVNLRKTMGGEQIAVLEKDSVWPMSGNVSTTKVGGYYWYPVNVNGKIGYVRDDCCFKLSPEQEESYLAGNGVPGGAPVNPPAETKVNYVQTTLDDVNLRISPSKDAQAPYNVKLGTVLAYNSSSTVGGSTWYRVVYQNQELWVLGSCVKVMSQKEYDDYLASKPAVTPQPEVVLGYVKTTAGGVNLRSTPNGSNILGRVDNGVVLAYSREPVVERNYSWYYVKTTLGYGYLRGDFLQECDAKGNPVESKPSTPPSTGGGQEATYKTLKRGSKGTAVKEMVAELKKQGFFTGAITDSFTSAVETAVKNFQKANSLTVDGIAGPNTLHKLFGTVPPGQGGTGNLDFTFYPAEKIDWFTGGIQTLWAKGANYKVYDVKTGIVWWAHRWSGGFHADVEPLTAADTARFCRMYGVSSADKINDRDHWYRRPSLVTIGNRTFACSLYGVPHNYPDGDTISTNNMKGQVCIHFTNSKTHTGNQVDTNHQEAIQYAWEKAPGGHK